MIITKERDDKSRREFPTIILEEDNISKNQVLKNNAEYLSTREIVTFLTFCVLYIIVIVMQSSIGNSFVLNDAFLKSLEAKDLTFSDVETEILYWSWLQGFVSLLFNENYYNNYAIPNG